MPSEDGDDAIEFVVGQPKSTMTLHGADRIPPASRRRCPTDGKQQPVPVFTKQRPTCRGNWRWYTLGNMPQQKNPGRKRGPKSPMSAEHKAALAAGRNESRAVKNYLDALESNRPKRGRKRTPDSIKKRLTAIEGSLPDADPLGRLKLVQERMDLRQELEAMGTKVEMGSLEDDFVKVARTYSERRGISYAAWREIGVDAAVLKRAGLTRAM